jgi:hypothetical protein
MLIIFRDSYLIRFSFLNNSGWRLAAGLIVLKYRWYSIDQERLATGSWRLA